MAEQAKSNDKPCLIEPNPDVVGVGIRASLYVLALSHHVFTYVFNSAELSRSIESSLGVTGLAIFLTAVITTARQSLDLFHALCVFHLLGILGLSARPRGRYPAGVVRTVVFMAFYVLVSAGSLAYLIYVFATAPTFGSRPACNDRTVYVLFGVDTRPAASPVLRWMLVAVLALLLLASGCWLLLATCVAVDALCGRELHGLSGGGRRDAELPRQQPPRPPPYWLASYLAGTVYLAVMLELTIRRNALAPGLDEWTFGQVMAMVMLIGPLIELASLLLGKVDGGQEGRLVPAAVYNEPG